MKPERSLRARLLRLVLVSLSLVLLIDAAGSYYIVHDVANDVYDSELNEIAREMLLHVTQTDGQPGFDMPAEAERTLLLDEYDNRYYAVRTQGGALIAGDPALPDMSARAAADRPLTFFNTNVQGTPVRVALLRGKPLVRDATEPVLIEVAETLVKRQQHERALLINVILPQVLLILLAGTLIWIGVARGLAPLRELQQAVLARSHLDLSPISARGVPAEVEPLVTAINDLMTRVDAVLNFQGRFIADTAHQLRTPVAGLKAHIELALREDDPQQIRRTLGHLYTGAERLSRLVSQLLSLARNEPHNVKTHFEAFDLNQLALRTTQDWVPHAYTKQIDLGFESAGVPVPINGEAARVTELINNLVDNAIRYTPAGKRVTVRVTRTAEHARLTVSDDGPRIPVEQRQRIFERFHRLLGTHEEGSGLGLAIVHEIATLHDAAITLEDDQDGVGNAFTVSFPILHA